MGIMVPTHTFVALNVLDELTHVRCLEQDQVVSALATLAIFFKTILNMIFECLLYFLKQNFSI